VNPKTCTVHDFLLNVIEIRRLLKLSTNRFLSEVDSLELFQKLISDLPFERKLPVLFSDVIEARVYFSPVWSYWLCAYRNWPVRFSVDAKAYVETLETGENFIHILSMQLLMKSFFNIVKMNDLRNMRNPSVEFP